MTATEAGTVCDTRPASSSLMPDPTECIERAITGLDVRAALDSLSTPHRQVVTEIYYNNRSVTETAHLLGIQAGTVKSRAYYAIRQLRSALAAARESPRRTAAPQASLLRSPSP